MNFDKIKSLLFSFWWVFLLAFLVFLSYGQTLNMYFWVDDWGMAYKMQHPDANIPNFGPGIFGDGAYRYNVTPFIMLYPLFGLNAYPYFALGLIFYFLASLVVYLLAKELSGKKSTGFISALIFASGYIGSDAMNHLNNSYQLVQTGILSALTVWLLIKHYQTDSKKYYLLAVLLYTAILEFWFLRSHGVFLLILSTSVLAVVFYKKLFLQTFLKAMPFFFIWFYMFFLDPRTSKKYDGVGRGDFLPNTINLVFEEKHIELFNNFLITLSSVVFPDEILFSIYRFISSKTDTGYIPLALPLLTAFFFLCLLSVKLKLSIKALITATTVLIAFFVYLVWSSLQSSAVWNPDPKQLFVSSWFGSFLVILGALYFLPILRKRLFLIYFGLAWIVSNVITYFIYSPTTNLASNTRYLIPAFIGACLLFGNILSVFSRKHFLLALIPVFIYCSLLISLTKERATYIVKNISIPAREDLMTIKKSIEGVNKDTVFYVEAASESKFRVSELGGIPHLAIPVVLDYHGIAKVALSYDEIFYLLKNNQAKIDNIYTFFGEKDSIVDTTHEFRKLLSEIGEEKELSEWRINTGNIGSSCCNTQTALYESELGTVGVNPVFETDLDYPSLMPLELTLKMKAKPLILRLNLPFADKTNHYLKSVDKESLAKEKISQKGTAAVEELERHLKSEHERMNVYKEVSISSTSSERTREPEFLTDNKNFTSWEANSVDWRNARKPVELEFKFESEKTFSNFVWINYNPKDTPVDYMLSISNDGSSWKAIKHVQTDVKDSGEISVDSFKKVTAKYFKISINRTYGGNTSAPAIAEAWIGEIAPVTDLEKREDLSSCVLCSVQSVDNISTIMSLYKNTAKAKVGWITNKSSVINPEDYKEFQLHLDGDLHTYKIYIPAQGSRIKKIVLSDFGYPVKVFINSASLKSMNLDEMENKNLIRKFAN